MLKGRKKKAPKHKFIVERHDSTTINALTEMKTVFTLLDKMAWLIQDIRDIFMHVFKNNYLNTQVDQVRANVNRCLEIHNAQLPSEGSSLEDQHNLIVKIIMPLIVSLNFNTIEAELKPMDKSTLRLESNDAVKLFMFSVRTRNASPIGVSYETILSNLASQTNTWGRDLGRQQGILNYAPVYAVLEMFLAKMNEFATGIAFHWKQLYDKDSNANLFLLSGSNSWKKLNETILKLDPLLMRVCSVFQNLKLFVTNQKVV